jgi:hypothetical protein
MNTPIADGIHRSWRTAPSDHDPPDDLLRIDVFYDSVMDHWRATLPISIHEVDYEEEADLEPVAQGMLATCGLDGEPACLEFHRTRRPIDTASATQVHRPIYAQAVVRWKNYECELAELFAALPRESSR